MTMKSPCATARPARYALPYPRLGSSTTNAPAARARSPLPSVEPLSTTITSPSKSLSSSTALAACTHSAIVSASSRHGMTTETRTDVGADDGTAVASCGLGGYVAVRICIVYDCLYPYTVGGAERWYRNLAERVASRGHEVTVLTSRQWERGHEPEIPGVRVIAVSPRMNLYAGGRRRIIPPLLFGLGVFLHLARHGGRFDVVHTASFPYFSLLAASSLRSRRG